MRLGGVQLLFDAMRTNPTNQPLQRYCCISLLHLSPTTIELTPEQADNFLRMLPNRPVGSPLMVLMAELTRSRENCNRLTAAAFPVRPQAKVLATLRKNHTQSLRQLIALLETVMHLTAPAHYAERIPADQIAQFVASCLPLQPQELDDMSDVLKYSVDMLGTFSMHRVFPLLCATLLQIIGELLQYFSLKPFARRCGVVEAVCLYMLAHRVNATEPLRASIRVLMSALAAADPRRPVELLATEKAELQAVLTTFVDPLQAVYPFSVFRAFLQRQYDPRAAEALVHDRCTLTAIPRCAVHTAHRSCPDCCALQAVYACQTCYNAQASPGRFCAYCARTHHAGHTLVELFEHASCCTAPSASSAAGDAAVVVPAAAAAGGEEAGTAAGGGGAMGAAAGNGSNSSSEDEQQQQQQQQETRAPLPQSVVERSVEGEAYPKRQNTSQAPPPHT